MGDVRAWLAVGAVALGLLSGGCGKTDSTGHRAAGAHGSARTSPPAGATGPSGPLTLPTPPPSGAPPARGAVAVIRGWSDALRRGDVRAAARYFALPSVMVNGPDTSGHVPVLNITTEAQAVAANVALPCGAKFASADQRGPFVNALFSLSGRSGPGGDCRGQRGTARVNFIIAAGHIVHWLRAPDDPGDRAVGPGTPPAPPSRPSPGGSSGSAV